MRVVRRSWPKVNEFHEWIQRMDAKVPELDALGRWDAGTPAGVRAAWRIN